MADAGIPEDSAIDPVWDQQNVIGYALTTDDLYRYSAQQVLMSWVMDLPTSVNPAEAAQALLAHYEGHPDLQPGQMQRDVIGLLKEVGESKKTTKSGRRLGGRRGRMSQLGLD